jgi:hypothetical protein
MKKTKTMTKAAIVVEIQKTDAMMWLELKRAEQRYGAEDEFVSTLRARWATIHNMMESVGIQADHTLPEAEEATRIMMQRLYGEQEA